MSVKLLLGKSNVAIHQRKILKKQMLEEMLELRYTSNVFYAESTDEPNPNTNSSDFNRLESLTKTFCFHAIFEM